MKGDISGAFRVFDVIFQWDGAKRSGRSGNGGGDEGFTATRG